VRSQPVSAMCLRRPRNLARLWTSRLWWTRHLARLLRVIRARIRLTWWLRGWLCRPAPLLLRIGRSRTLRLCLRRRAWYFASRLLRVGRTLRGRTRHVAALWLRVGGRPARGPRLCLRRWMRDFVPRLLLHIRRCPALHRRPGNFSSQTVWRIGSRSLRTHPARILGARLGR
jgi:hypothetical protein